MSLDSQCQSLICPLPLHVLHDSLPLPPHTLQLELVVFHPALVEERMVNLPFPLHDEQATRPVPLHRLQLRNVEELLLELLVLLRVVILVDLPVLRLGDE